MANLNAIILAAGQGTRMKSEMPKVLHPICGRPMIAYTFDLVASLGIKHPIVVLGHGASAVKPLLPDEISAVTQNKQLGTGDAVLTAKKALNGVSGDVLILYGDTPLLHRSTIHRLIETHIKAHATCTILTAHFADPTGYGRIVRDENGVITGIVEETEVHAPQRGIREINVGPIICKTKALIDALAMVRPSTSKKEVYLTHAVTYLARQEGTKIQTSGVEEISEALGINSRTDLSRAIGVIRQRIIDSHLRNGVTIEDAQSTFIDFDVSIGVDSVIRPYCVIESGVTIGKRCHIGPFARLRAGTSLSEEVRVGNFAELVRTKVGPRVRINHVSYLGDATIDEAVNIGAGAITANFDGHSKHATHIGKSAFIGSDTVLVAPIKIGSGAITGAGSVVTKGNDVPNRGIAVGVPARLLDQRAPDLTSNSKKTPADKSQKMEYDSADGKLIISRRAKRQPKAVPSNRLATIKAAVAMAKRVAKRVKGRTIAKRVIHFKKKVSKKISHKRHKR